MYGLQFVQGVGEYGGGHQFAQYRTVVTWRHYSRHWDGLIGWVGDCLCDREALQKCAVYMAI